MDVRTCAVEDLPPLELCPLRDLDLREPPSEGREPHISSASGVARRGDFVYVIGDDLLHLGVFRLSRGQPGELARVFEGRLPADADARKEHKPDLEALTVLPPFAGSPFGALLGIGSGSAPGRDRAFVWSLRADGGPRGNPEIVDLGPVYRALSGEIEYLNVEGAAVVGERLWLLHRGNHRDARNAVAEMDLERVMASLSGDLRIDVHELAGLRFYDLGELDGIRLTFSDATPLGGDLVVFTASAEGEGDRIADGEIRGSVVGTIAPDGEVRRLRTIDRRWKVEGVHATIDTGVIDLLFVCDQDDPAVASPLLSAAMPVEAAFERNDADAG